MLLLFLSLFSFMKFIVYMLLYILVFKEITTILQINIYKIDKQQGPTIEHTELYSISCNYPEWKRKKLKL